MGSDRPVAVPLAEVIAEISAVDPEFRAGVERTERELDAEEAARQGVRAEVLLVGQVLAERWHRPRDECRECAETAQLAVAAMERAGLLRDVSGNPPSGSAAGRTDPPERDAMSETIRRGADALVRLRTQAPSVDELEPDAARFWHRDAEVVLLATAPLIEAAALRAYAERHHHVADGHGPISTPSGWIDPAAYCACGAECGEDGCTERAQLLADAEQISGLGISEADLGSLRSAAVAEAVAREIEDYRDKAQRDTTVDTDAEQRYVEAALGALDIAAGIARRIGAQMDSSGDSGTGQDLPPGGTGGR